VNGSQLFATNQQVATNTAAIGNLTTVVTGLSGGAAYVRVNSTGPLPTASGANSIAIGPRANANGDNSLAMGNGAQATQDGALALGFNSAATGVNSIAIGTGATATGSVAVGTGAQASNGGAAFGDGAVATASLSTAIGPNARATAPNATAIGQGAVADQANTVSVGSLGNQRRITNVAPGVDPSDVATIGQLSSVAAGFNTHFDELRRETRRGIAANAALATAMTPSAPGKTTVSMNTGFFQGEAGVGIAIAHRLNAAVPMILHGSYASSGGDQHVGRAGLAFEF